MERVKDFFYFILKRILLIAILASLAYVVFTNLDYLMNIKATSQDVKKIVQKEQNKEIIEITIPEGINSSQLAKLLKGYKLIKDEEIFVTKFDEINKDKDIKSGSFSIDKSSDLDKIIKILTN